MNQDSIMAVLPDSKDDAKSLKEIAQDIGLGLGDILDETRPDPVH